MKRVIILCDGMADEPVPELDGKTPLEAAKHPRMDRLAATGRFGVTRAVPEGMAPGSDTANLSVFGYDPRSCYTGRSPLEAVSIGVKLDDDDVVYRCNLVTLSEEENLDDATMLDYSAGEISQIDAKPLITQMRHKFNTKTVQFYQGVSYRNCMVLKHGKTGAILTPPHDISGQCVRGKLPQGENRYLLRAMMDCAYQLLPRQRVNRERVERGIPMANCVWFWGEGTKPKLESYQSRFGVKGTVISAVDLIQGIGILAGLQVVKVPGATGNYQTNYSGKAQAAVEALQNGSDFVYVHIEAPDECGHRGQVKEKIYAIEQIDEKILAPIWAYLEGCGEPYGLLVMPDHPTPLVKLTHTGDPVPFALYDSRSSYPNAKEHCYTEREARETGVTVQNAFELTESLMRS